MKTLAIVALKGGSGKTTTALALALSAQDPGRVVILDLDPQASSSAARRLADQADWPATVAVAPEHLATVLARARELQAPLILIDTPPAAGEATRAAVAAADAALIVTRPAAFDLLRVPDALAICREAGRRPVAVVIAQRPSDERQREIREAVDYVSRLGVPLAPALGQRVAFARLGTGEALTGAARDEAIQLYNYATSELIKETP